MKRRVFCPFENLPWADRGFFPFGALLKKYIRISKWVIKVLSKGFQCVILIEDKTLIRITH
jgi:hypothetical protein